MTWSIDVSYVHAQEQYLLTPHLWASIVLSKSRPVTFGKRAPNIWRSFSKKNCQRSRLEDGGSGTVEGSALDAWSVLSATNRLHCMERLCVYQHLLSRANSS